MKFPLVKPYITREYLRDKCTYLVWEYKVYTDVSFSTRKEAKQ